MKMHIIGFLLPLLASIHTVQAIPLETASPTTLSTKLSRDATETTFPDRAFIPTPPPELLIRDATSTSTTSVTSTCIPTVQPDQNGYVPPDQCDALYDYYPSFSAAVAFTVLFGLLLGAHIVEGIVYKTRFVWVITMGVAWEFGGYLTRAFSTKNQQSSGLATVTQLLVLLAPLWVNAFDYMVLARMMWFFLPERKIWIFKPSLLAIIFVCLDFGSFLVQATGGLMASPRASASTIQTGLHIYMGGIGIQEFFICCFCVLAIQFHCQVLRLEKEGALQGEKLRWRGLLYSLYFSLATITVRIIYRLIEFTGGLGLNNTVTTHEWFMYVFDAFPMLLAAGVWCVLHPGRILTGPDAELPPSGVGRILCCGYCACCCCCGGSRKRRNDKKNMDGMVALTQENTSDEELRPVRYNNDDGVYYSTQTPSFEPGRIDRYESYRPQLTA